MAIPAVINTPSIIIPNYAFSPALKTSLGLTLSNNNLTITSAEQGYTPYCFIEDYVDTTFGQKLYLEMNWSLGGSGPAGYIGGAFTLNTTPYLGLDLSWPFGFNTHGTTIYTHSSFTDVYIGSGGTYDTTANGTFTFTSINTMMMAIDFTNNKVWFGKNGIWSNSADPASNVGGASFASRKGSLNRFYFGMGCVSNPVGVSSCTLQAPAYTVPAGFISLI